MRARDALNEGRATVPKSMVIRTEDTYATDTQPRRVRVYNSKWILCHIAGWDYSHTAEENHILAARAFVLKDGWTPTKWVKVEEAPKSPNFRFHTFEG
jgi:hypothetical protein